MCEKPRDETKRRGCRKRPVRITERLFCCFVVKLFLFLKNSLFSRNPNTFTRNRGSRIPVDVVDDSTYTYTYNIFQHIQYALRMMMKTKKCRFIPNSNESTAVRVILAERSCHTISTTTGPWPYQNNFFKPVYSYRNYNGFPILFLPYFIVHYNLQTSIPWSFFHFQRGRTGLCRTDTRRADFVKGIRAGYLVFSPK